MPTGLRCAARIDHTCDGTGVFCVVMPDASVPGSVCRRFGEHTARRPLDVQILDCDVGELVHREPGELVRKAPSPIGDADMQPGDAKPYLAPPVAVAPLAGNGALGASIAGAAARCTERPRKRWVLHLRWIKPVCERALRQNTGKPVSRSTQGPGLCADARPAFRCRLNRRQSPAGDSYGC